VAAYVDPWGLSSDGNTFSVAATHYIAAPFYNAWFEGGEAAADTISVVLIDDGFMSA
jgi:hypothetical protein